MACRKPYMLGILPCPCGRCDVCRINRRRLWRDRLLLESFKHGDSCFVTLTYEDSRLPVGENLVPADVQTWIRNVRYRVYPQKVRYFVSGEYGEKGLRPHYHAILFGLSTDVAGGDDGLGGVVQDAWRLGFTQVAEFNEATASYVAGYVTKKVTVRNDPRLVGRYPEFTRMSLRPGIGAHAMDDVSRSLVSSDAGLDSVVRNNDVPGSLKHVKGYYQFGRYLKRVLRGSLGFGTKDTPEVARMAHVAELRQLYQEAQALPENTSKTLQKIVIDKTEQKMRNQVARHRIFDSRRVL